MAKITVKNTRPLNGNISQEDLETPPPAFNDSFLVDIQEFSPNLHVFRATDRNHDLRCEMILEVTESLISLDEEVEEDAYLAPVVACVFPTINIQKLHEITGFDSYLQGILIFQFQLKILGQLLLFCEERDAVHLALIINDTDLNYLEIYSRFFISEERITTSRGEQIQIVIPTDVHTYDEIIDFMDKLDKDFRKILWRGQNTNSAFREYLKSNACV